jgi:hypothetical protein
LFLTRTAYSARYNLKGTVFWIETPCNSEIGGSGEYDASIFRAEVEAMKAGGKLWRHIPPKRWAASKLNGVAAHKKSSIHSDLKSSKCNLFISTWWYSVNSTGDNDSHSLKLSTLQIQIFSFAPWYVRVPLISKMSLRITE